MMGTPSVGDRLYNNTLRGAMVIVEDKACERKEKW